MARLRKLIECSSDDDESLPDLQTILSTTKPNRVPQKAARTPRGNANEGGRVPSTHALFANGTAKKLSKSSRKDDDVIIISQKTATANEEILVKPAEPSRRQRVLKTLKTDDSLLNKLASVSIEDPPKPTTKEPGSRARRSPVKKQNVATKTDSRSTADTSSNLPTNDAYSESDSDVPRRARRSPVKKNYREPAIILDDEGEERLTNTVQETETAEESILCASDSDRDSFIVNDSDVDGSEDSDAWTELDRKSTRWADVSIPKLLPPSKETPFQPSTVQITEQKTLAQSTISQSTHGDRPSSSSSTDHNAILKFSPKSHRSPRKLSNPRAERPVTPPPKTPAKVRLTSPSKQRAQVPTPPNNKPHADDFWDAQTVNDWHDQHSPQKPLLSPSKKLKNLLLRSISPSSDPETPPSPTASPRKSNKSPEKKSALAARREFDAEKDNIAHSFLAELDSRITQNQLSTLTASAGGVKIIWSKTLNSTAGRANWRREVLRLRPSNTGSQSSQEPIDRSKLPTRTLHHASIELSLKVIDCRTRLYNVIAHEFCHLANFMVSQITHSPHGKEFRAWGAKVSAAFAHLDVHVTTKHSYEIDYKYVWACAGCGQEYKRHSKSVDVKRHACSVCKGVLVQVRPAPRKGGESEYQVFVKEQYKRIKSECEKRGLKGQGSVMEALGKEYRERKEARTEIGLGKSSGKALETMLESLKLDT